MAKFTALLLLALVCLVAQTHAYSLNGMKCVACTAGFEIAINYLKLHPQPINQFVEQHLCELFNEPLMKSICHRFVNAFGDMIAVFLLQKLSSDEICTRFTICKNNPTCRLHPMGVVQSRILEAQQDLKLGGRLEPLLLLNDPWDILKGIYETLAIDHKPLRILDIDGDSFSTIETLRGTHWKGRDCNDLDADIYPGRKVNPYPGKDEDYNCNGIVGTDPQTNLSWKEQLCANTTQYGIAVIGDSFGAHFHIPESWINASMINTNTYQNLITKTLDEFDLPHKSAVTGYEGSSPSSPVRSLYKRMLERNRCNHRDYQNVAVNGGDSNDTVVNLKALKRNQTTDNPMLVVMELIGNDVCHYPQEYTPANYFKDALIGRLEYLDTVLPNGSHVILLGLVNGSELYNYLENEMHPLGVHYPAFYDFLACQKASPCPGWLTSNKTLRDLATKYAMEINQEYKKFMAEKRVYKHFDYDYYEIPGKEITDAYVAKGGYNRICGWISSNTNISCVICRLDVGDSGERAS